jgi:hypothetical protein
LYGEILSFESLSEVKSILIACTAWAQVCAVVTFKIGLRDLFGLNLDYTILTEASSALPEDLREIFLETRRASFFQISKSQLSSFSVSFNLM